MDWMKVAALWKISCASAGVTRCMVRGELRHGATKSPRGQPLRGIATSCNKIDPWGFSPGQGVDPWVMVIASEGEHPRVTRSHTMKTILATAFAALALATPAQAGMNETKTLMGMIKSTGTTISFNNNHYDKNCLNNAGYYFFKEKVQDLMVICTDQVNTKDGDALWEVVAHEATHIMQACLGGNLIKDAYVARMHRELRAQAPHYSKMVGSYSTAHQLEEAEAYWMELQAPADVLGHFKRVCIDGN